MGYKRTREYGTQYWTLRRSGICLTSSFLICTTAPEEGRAAPKTEEVVSNNRLRISERFDDARNFSQCQMAGLQCAVWKPENIEGRVPLVIFSHGFKGSNTQSAFLMKALAKAGYLVVAPNHQDALSRSSFLTRPEIGFLKSEEWTENTYKSRRDDILNLLAALKSEPNWNDRLDWGKLALVGHSLGGYTALGLGGAWPGWKIPEVKAVLALSPYCKPFTIQNTLSHLNLPVMYQGGTRDNGITPTLEGPEGAFAKTSSPAYFVDFDGFSHFSWTGLNRNEQKQELVNHYSLAFLNKYLRSDKSANPSAKLPGVAFIQVK